MTAMTFECSSASRCEGHVAKASQAHGNGSPKMLLDFVYTRGPGDICGAVAGAGRRTGGEGSCGVTSVFMLLLRGERWGRGGEGGGGGGARV